jgi:hypothetical protein
MSRELTQQADLDRADFYATFGSDGNCSCHIDPPCGSCVHPGNPLNQDEDDSCWVEVNDSE